MYKIDKLKNVNISYNDLLYLYNLGFSKKMLVKKIYKINKGKLSINECTKIVEDFLLKEIRFPF